MATKNKVQIIAEKGKQEVFIIREFEAPAEHVFKAFTDPDILSEIYSAECAIIKYEHCEFKRGGTYRYSVNNDKGDFLCAFNGVVHEVKPSERIIITQEYETPDGGHVVLETYLFERLPNERTKLTIHDVCRSVEDCIGMMQSGMETGLERGFGKLDELLEKELQA